jgi:hypothetical protein
MNDLIPLIIFAKRMKLLGINIEFFGNYPWVYIDTINGKKVTERFQAKHGFTIAFRGVKPGEMLQFTDIIEIFKLIRKYTNELENKNKDTGITS